MPSDITISRITYPMATNGGFGEALLRIYLCRVSLKLFTDIHTDVYRSIDTYKPTFGEPRKHLSLELLSNDVWPVVQLPEFAMLYAKLLRWINTCA